MRGVPSAAATLAATAWRISPGKTVLAAVLVLAEAVAGPALAWALGRMTDAVLDGRAGDAAGSGVLVAALAVVTVTFGHLAHIAYFELAELAELDFDERLIAVTNGSPRIGHLERPEFNDSLTVVQRESRQLSAGFGALLNGVALAFAMLLTGILLARLHPALLLLPLAAVPPLLTGRWAERIADRARTDTAQRTRLGMHLFNLCTDSRPAGELRVLNLQDEVSRRHRQLWDDVSRTLLRADVAATWARAAGQTLFAAAYVGAVLVVVREAAAGRRSVGDVVLVLALAAQVNQQVSTAVALLQDLHRMSALFRRFEGLRREAGEAAPEPGVAEEAPTALRDGIRFENVSFTYPGTGAPVLTDVDLTLPAGTTIAVVGENGAGKSTLVKLLCGFYTPTGGRILADGTDLRRIPVEQWRARIAAGFQDFVKPEFRVRHAVGVGDLDQGFRDEAVAGALGRAQASDVLARLPDGLATQLGQSHSGGAELSGGQWQKFALGRAFMRTSPLVLILDEPTSALDPEAEHALFEQYSAQSRRTARATGAVTVLVSHRFSTVRTADLIVVVADGRVVESGDHATLLRQGGRYADLFAIHSHAYR